MITLSENSQVGLYTVSHLIKQSTYNGTYKVKGQNGTAYFMKFFQVSAVPEKQLLDGEVMEIVYSRKISHGNVISYVTDGIITIQGEEYRYLVTEFFHGTLLSEILEGGKTLPYEDTLKIMEGVLSGLDYLHSKDLYHNDITPRNILLEDLGQNVVIPRIIDMGHLCPASGGTPPYSVDDLNVRYVAPEMLSGMNDAKSDVFSAAAVMYTMLTGNAPWTADIADDELFYDKKKKIRNARREPLDTAPLMKAIPDLEVRKALWEALALNPDSRLSLDEFMGRLFPDRMSGDRKESPKTDSQQKDERTEVKVEIKKAQGGGFADVAGMEALKAELTNRVIWVLRDKEKAAKYRLSPPNGMILYGPPGCGKTFFAQKFAEETGFNFVLVNGSDLGSIYVHGTQGKIAELFKQAEKTAPTILCFDEFDSFVPSRSSSAAEHRSEEVNEFLGQLNNCSQRGIFVIGTTNRIDLIDPAVLRKGRMDLHVEIPAPDARTRSLIFDIHLRNRPLAEDVNTGELAELTENYAAADIAFIVNEAAMMAALADVDISQSHLINSIKSNTSSLAPKETRTKIGF